jgi:hypothetical protein
MDKREGKRPKDAGGGGGGEWLLDDAEVEKVVRRGVYIGNFGLAERRR